MREGSAAAFTRQSPAPPLPSVGGSGVYSHLSDGGTQPHTGLTQGVGRGGQPLQRLWGAQTKGTGDESLDKRYPCGVSRLG